MRILVIGGTGTISTVAVSELAARGHALTVFNRSRTAARYEGEVARVTGDRTRHAEFESRMAGLGVFDCVMDMVGFTPADAESALRAFVGKCGQYVFCSTVDVYAKVGAGFPTTEARALGGVSQYAKDKQRCEEILSAAHAQGDINLTILRPATIYGAGSAPSHTFGRGTGFLDRLRKGKPVVVHGDGSSLWCWCYCDDAGRAFANAAGNTRAFGRAYHITGEERMTWAHYYGCVAQALDAPPARIVPIPTGVLARIAPERAKSALENYQFNNVFDTSAARADLDFRYTVPVVEGVRRSYAWLAANDRIVNSDEDTFEDDLIARWHAAVEDLANGGNPHP